MTSALQLTRYENNDGIEILINPVTGESFCSVKGYARMSGRDKSTIQERLRNVTEVHQGGGENGFKTAEVLTNGGIQRVGLITEDQIVEWLPKDNPAMASKLLRMGVRIALHGMAGHSVTTTATAPIPDFTATPSHPIDAQIQRALALAGSPGVLAIETFKMLNGLVTPVTTTIPTTPAIPSPPAYPPSPKKLTPQQQWAQGDRDLFDEFLAKLRIALDKGMLDSSMKVDVNHNGNRYVAIVLLSVLDVLETALGYRVSTYDLRRVIAKHGGKVDLNQRFEPESPAKRNGHRSIQRKCIVIPTSLI